MDNWKSANQFKFNQCEINKSFKSFSWLYTKYAIKKLAGFLIKFSFSKELNIQQMHVLIQYNVFERGFETFNGLKEKVQAWWFLQKYNKSSMQTCFNNCRRNYIYNTISSSKLRVRLKSLMFLIKNSSFNEQTCLK